jgi:hypothetical protein
MIVKWMQSQRIKRMIVRIISESKEDTNSIGQERGIQKDKFFKKKRVKLKFWKLKHH